MAISRALVTLVPILAIVPASAAWAGHGLFQRPQPSAAVVPAGPQPYVAYRPVYPMVRGKALVLSSYAGSNYPSVAPGAAVTPTEFRALTGRPLVPAWFGLGAGR